VPREAQRGRPENRLGDPQVRVLGEQELDHLAATPGADPLGRRDVGAQPAVGVEVSPYRVEVSQRRREAEVVDPGAATGERLRGPGVAPRDGRPQWSAVVVDPVDPGTTAALDAMTGSCGP